MNKDSIASPVRPDNDKKVNFSPVYVRQSPVSKTPQRGNITGNPRTVRDAVADLYNLIQKWNTSHLKGVEILAKISALKMATMDTISRNESDVYPEGVQYYCESLEKILKELTDVVSKMERISSQLKAVCDLENYQQNFRGRTPPGSSTPLFLTWPVEKFAEVSSELVSRYVAELEVKQMVLEGVCHCRSRDTLMFHLAAWAHQPTMVDESAAQCQMESMLIETGYR